MMGRTRGTFKLGLVLLPLLLVACAKANEETDATGKASSSIAGTYQCSREDDPDAPAYAWEFREDGTLKNLSPPDIVALGTTAEEKIVEGTWSAKGDSGKVTSENEDYPFTIEERGLVFAGGKFLCHKVE